MKQVLSEFSLDQAQIPDAERTRRDRDGNPEPWGSRIRRDSGSEVAREVTSKSRESLPRQIHSGDSALEDTDLQGKANGEGGNRTHDTTIFSRVLYQLSYLAVAGLGVSPAGEG
jgi:hypothetical protein